MVRGALRIGTWFLLTAAPGSASLVGTSLPPIRQATRLEMGSAMNVTNDLGASKFGLFAGRKPSVPFLLAFAIEASATVNNDIPVDGLLTGFSRIGALTNMSLLHTTSVREEDVGPPSQSRKAGTGIVTLRPRLREGDNLLGELLVVPV